MSARSDSESGFVVLENGENVQTAVMTLGAGEESGPFANEHPASEQVLFVVRGTLESEIGSERRMLKAGDSVIVPRAVPHRFVNRSSEPTVTFNVYSPKAY